MPAGAIGPARQRLLSGCRTSAGWSWDQQILPLPMPHDGYVLQIPAIVTVLSTQASIAVVEVVLGTCRILHIASCDRSSSSSIVGRTHNRGQTLHISTTIGRRSNRR